MLGSPRLDRIDINILSTLQEQGNITNVNLAEAVNLSASPCLQRVKRLQQAGYIECYRAVINLKKFPDHVIVFTEVTLSDHRRGDFAKFEAAIAKHPNVMECHLVSGGYDYLVKFVARSISQYQAIIEELIDGKLAIEKYFSYIVIKSVVTDRGVPLKDLISVD